MQHRYCFQSVDKLLKDIRSDERLFGGLPVVLGGDFAQILPVVRRGTRASTVAVSIHKSNIWPQLHVLFLTQNMRLSTDESGVFAKWLKEMPYDLCWRDRIELPPFFSRTETMDQFYEAGFPSRELHSSAWNDTFFRNRAIITFRNDVVADFNQKLLDKLPGELYTYDFIDAVEDNAEKEHYLPQEFLRSLMPSGLPSTLCLKVGAPIVLLQNLYPASGECNGTRLIITRLGRRCIKNQMLGGEFTGQLRLIPRIKLTTTENDPLYILTQRQYPIRLCFAMTVNKSQGQSLKTVGVNLRTSDFTYGQLYVAFSHVTTLQGITILTAENSDGKTNNVVYPEVLLRPPDRQLLIENQA